MLIFTSEIWIPKRTFNIIALALLLSLSPLNMTAFAKEAPSGWVEDESKANQPVVTKGAGGKIILQGGVEHSVTLPSLPEALKMGSVYNEKALPGPSGQDQWYMIPNWLAGRWLRTEETILSTYIFDSHQQYNQPRTISLREMADFGVQLDKLGHVWHYRLASRGVADKGSTLSVALVQSQTPLEVTDNEVIIRDLFTEIQVNKGNNIIIEANQAESISHFTPARDGIIKTTVSIKFFREDGSPDRQQENQSFESRIEPFAPCDTYKGTNLRQSFIDFLRADGKEDLIPIR